MGSHPCWFESSLRHHLLLLVDSNRSRADRAEILTTLRKAGPSTVTELMRAAGAERGQRRRYRQILRTLVRDGEIFLDRKGRLSLDPADAAGRRVGRSSKSSRGRRAEAHAGVARGGAEREQAFPERAPAPVPGSPFPVARFEGHRDGFGFINPADGSRDVFIPPHRTGGALHGDMVEYRVLATGPDGRREGGVVRIAAPTGQTVVGLVTRVVPRIEVVPFDGRVGASFTLAPPAPVSVGEGVAVTIEIPRPGAGRSGPARLMEVLGPISRPGVDIEVLIRKHALRIEFPETVLRETAAIPEAIPREVLAAREDFSRGTVVTIDGDTARDFDDAIGVAALPRGAFQLAVHIADVAHYVPVGSATDIEARLRGTSVYFPGRAIPMLPPALSENVCSLKPDVPRLVQTVVMTFDAKGNPGRVRFADGWIRSRARLTYGRVNALLKGAPVGASEKPLLADIRRMNELALLLAQRRAARGGLDFDLPEPEVVLDALGAAAGVRPAHRGPAQRLIEEFMIAANIAVAHYLVEVGQEALHRVHERPDPLKVSELGKIVRAFGLDFDPDPEEVEPLDFRGLLDRMAGRPEERTLGRLLLRTMALARYAPEPLGHFGLAAKDYLHFTSPIRRYPDLVAHRALRHARASHPEAAETSPAPRALRGRGSKSTRRKDRVAETASARLSTDALDFLGAECSRLERAAEGAERESLAWKRAEVLQGRLGDEMDGTISTVAPQGVYVELDEVYAEGLLPVAALPPDRYAFDGMRLALAGERTGRVYRAGQRVKVLVARVDRILQRTELALVGSEGGGVSAAPRKMGQYGFRDARDRAENEPKNRGRARGRARGRR